MKIVLIYRRPAAGAYSIEAIFHSVAAELRKGSEVIEYQAGARWELPLDVWRLRQMNADVYHLTGDINYLSLFLPHRKTVLTVHDIGHYLFGLSGVKRWTYKLLWLLWPIRRVRAVTTVSKETNDNIRKHLSVNGAHIETIENCHSALFKPSSRPFNSDCPVILQVGTKPYKNVPRLIEALRGIKCRLVLVGEVDEALRRLIRENGVESVNHVNLSHEEIARQYAACDIVSFVSLGEGFGVPIIEAQACGRPLITAAASPMREVAGEGACLADPLDASQIRAGIVRIIEDPQYRDQLVASGLRNIERYSPAGISNRYLDLYRRIARV